MISPISLSSHVVQSDYQGVLPVDKLSLRGRFQWSLPSPLQAVHTTTAQFVCIPGSRIHDVRLVLPNFLTKWLDDGDIVALIDAHWSQFAIEEIVSQRSHEENPEDEADDFMEMQLALHMMDRARLEATLYEDAFSKAMDKSATRSRRSVYQHDNATSPSPISCIRDCMGEMNIE